MNMQAMLKQAQQMQKQMLAEQDKISNMDFTATNGLVTVNMKGSKRINKVYIKKEDDFSSDDLDMLEDMIMVAVNDCLAQIDKETEEKMGKYTRGLPF